MKIKILYFASLQEESNKTQEELELQESQCANAKELYEYLASKYNFELSIDDLKVAINEAYSDFSTPLKEGDVVAFIPPIAGG